MKKLRIASIREGQQHAESIFLPNGQKVVPAGVVVGEQHVRLLLRQSATEVYLADSAEQVQQAQRNARKPRQKAGAPHRGRQRGEPGEAASQPFAAGSAVAAPTRSACRSGRHEQMARAEEIADRFIERCESLDRRIRPEEMEIWDRHRASGAPWPERDALLDRRRQWVQTIGRVHRRFEQGQAIDQSSLDGVVNELWAMLIDHRERFTQLALNVPRSENYLPGHALSVAVLAMATAGQLTWGAEAVRRAGLAALLADLGMLLIPARIRIGGEQLTDIDRGRVQRHPLYSLAVLEELEDLDDRIRLAVLQHHERENGTGYPRGSRGDDISDLARVLAVADVFAALTSPRHYRKHKLPYVAMEQMVRSAASCQYDKPSTRALVQAAGLFPVGSYVKLSNNRLALVIASNANHLDRPIVQLLDEEGRPRSAVLDLRQLPAKALTVTRPVPAPSAPRSA